MVYLTFRTTFNAVHVLRNPNLSDAANRRAFRECANPAGHGHRFGLEVTVASDVNADHPTVLSRGAIARNVREVIQPVLANADLNKTFGRDDFIPTGENLTRAVWDLLSPALQERLVAVRIAETAKNSFTYYGPEGPPEFRGKFERAERV